MKRVRIPMARALTIATLALIATRATAGPSRKVVATVLSVPNANAIEPRPDELRDISAHASEAERAKAIEWFRARLLEARIVSPLHKRFCAANACEPTKEDIQAVLDMGTHATGSGESPGAPSTKAKAERSKSGMGLQRREDREMARDWVATWKFHKALHEKYGGEVIMQVTGPNAVGARRKWLEDEEAQGHFHIFAPDLRVAFFDAVSAYGGRPISAEDAGKVFDQPPWAPMGREPSN